MPADQVMENSVVGRPDHLSDYQNQLHVDQLFGRVSE
jgi:hypothetical protein